MKKYFLLVMFLFSATAESASVVCAGSVKKIGLHAPDALMLQLSSMNRAVFICNPSKTWTVNGTSHSTSGETCKVIMSMLMHAKSTQAEIPGLYFDGDDVPAGCDQWEPWKRANIRYFMY